jgi:hypothetical protein
MTATDQITAYLNQNQGLAFCDDCLSNKLAIAPRQAIQQKTYKLANSPLFERKAMFCVTCKKLHKLAIRKKLASA